MDSIANCCLEGCGLKSDRHNEQNDLHALLNRIREPKDPLACLIILLYVWLHVIHEVMGSNPVQYRAPSLSKTAYTHCSAWTSTGTNYTWNTGKRTTRPQDYKIHDVVKCMASNKDTDLSMIKSNYTALVKVSGFVK